MKIMKNVFAVVLTLTMMCASGCAEAGTPSGSSSQVPSSSSQTPSSSTQVPSSSTQIPSSSTQIPSSSTQAPNVPKWEVNDAVMYNKDGEAVKLSDFLGKPVIINVWATWCQPCRNELPDFQKAYETYGDEVVFLMINLTYSEDPASYVDVFLSTMEYDFPVYYDRDGSVYRALLGHSQQNAVPQTFFISASGKLLEYKVGMVSWDYLEDNIEFFFG